MTAPLLQVEGLRVAYRGHDGTVTAVRGIDFSVAHRESLAIVGESGCGKTSVALALLGLLNPRHTTVSGAAHFDGRDLLSLPLREIRQVRGGRVGMIFQDPMTSLNPYLRVGTQIAEPLACHRDMPRKQARQEAARLLNSVGFPPPTESHLGRYPHEFSGGMCQRAMIASSLACSPDLLIADEPTTALDVITQDQVLDLIEQKRREHRMAMLLITHDLGIVAAVSDRVAVMYKGEIVEAGTTDQIYGHPQHDYTKALLGAVPRLDKPRTRRLQTLSGSSSGMEGESPCPPNLQRMRTSSRSRATPPDSAPALLSAEDMTVEFHSKPAAPWCKGDTVRAVDRVSLHVTRGEVLGLVGQSGSGKSTLVRAMLGLVPVASGKVVFEGEDITHADRAKRRNCWQRMQLIFQDPYGSLNGRLTIGQAVAQPLRQLGIVPRKECRREVTRLLELVRIPTEWQSRFPHELSGGQRQRIAIARALAPRPELLFCDEPVSALDVSIQADVLNLLADLRETLGLTVLFISHDLAVVRHVADRVGVMHEGHIVDMLHADEIGRRCGHPYTQRLLDAVPIPDPAARRGGTNT